MWVLIKIRKKRGKVVSTWGRAHMGRWGRIHVGTMGSGEALEYGGWTKGVSLGDLGL